MLLPIRREGEEIFYKDLKEDLEKLKVPDAEKTVDNLFAAQRDLIDRDNFNRNRLEDNACPMPINYECDWLEEGSDMSLQGLSSFVNRNAHGFLGRTTALIGN